MKSGPAQPANHNPVATPSVFLRKFPPPGPVSAASSPLLFVTPPTPARSPTRPARFVLTLMNIGSPARCYRFLGSLAFSMPHFPFSDSGPVPISTLHFEISNPPLPFILQPLALPRGKTYHSPLATSPLSGLISNPSRPFSLLPSSFSLSKIPSPSRKDPSRKPEYPPLSRNIPPFPRISPPPILVRNQFQHSHIHHDASNPLKTPSLTINHLPPATNTSAQPFTAPMLQPVTQASRG